jgi:hypothetical protein
MSKISLKHSGGNVVSLNSPTSAPTSADVAFKLPNADGSAGQFMKTDGSGNLSFDAAGGGKILQVIQAVKTDTFSTASTSYTDVTGVSVSITPSSSSNKVLVMVEANSSTTGGNNAMFRLKRDSTTLSVGDAAGSRSQAAYQQRINDSNAALNGSITLLDSPSTTSSTTYQLQTKVQGGTVDINRTAANTDGAAYARTICTITAMEVAA